MRVDLIGSDVKLFSAPDAAVRLQRSFRMYACKRRPKNLSLQDELVQEMSMAVLLCEGENTLGFFRARGRSRGANYLRNLNREEKHFDPLDAHEHHLLVEPDKLSERQLAARAELKSRGMEFLLVGGYAA